MDGTVHPLKETCQPLPHVAPAGFINSILFYGRLFFDLWVSAVYRDVKKYLQSTKNNVLEVGCGDKPYRHLVPDDVKYCGIDWGGSKRFFHYNNSDVVYYDGDIFPLSGESFDYIFHTEVLEHVYKLDRFLSECYRVLSKKGKMFFTVPFAARNHYILYDYWRFTPVSIEMLLASAGFKHIVVEPRGSDIIVIIAKINTLFLKTIMHDIRNPIFRVINILFWGIIFLIPLVLCTLLGHILFCSKVGSVDDPLGYSVYCEK